MTQFTHRWWVLLIGDRCQWPLSNRSCCNVRAVDIATGQVLATVNTSKTVISTEIRAGVFRYLDYKKLFSGEGGVTHNEPVQLCLTSAIETAVIHLVIQGIEQGIWQLANADDWQSSAIFRKYLAQASDL